MIKWLENNRIASLIITILIAAEIFYFSTLTGRTSIETGSNMLPIIYHFVVFFLFSFFVLITIKGKNNIQIKYVLVTIVISVLYAFSDEFHQIFVPGRNANMNDILIDGAGILFSIIINFINYKKD